MEEEHQTTMSKRRRRPLGAVVATASALALSATGGVVLLRRGVDDASDGRGRRSLRRRERRSASPPGDAAPTLNDPSQIMPVQVMGEPDLYEPPLIATLPTQGEIIRGGPVADPAPKLYDPSQIMPGQVMGEPDLDEPLIATLPPPREVPLGDQVVDPVLTVMATIPFVPQVPHVDPVEEFYPTGIEISDPFPPPPHTDPVDEFFPPPHTDPVDEFSPPPHIDPVDEFYPPPHTDPVDEFFPPPHTDPVDEFFPPPHTDPVDEFTGPTEPIVDPVDEFICMDDPSFAYEYKDKHEVTCKSLWLDRQASVICRTLLDDGVSIGAGYCPVTCHMVDECLAREAALAGGAGGGTAAPTETDDGDGEGPTKKPYWWAVEDEDGRKTHCVYNSEYLFVSKEHLHPSEYRCEQTLDEILVDETATAIETGSENARTDPTSDASKGTPASASSSNATMATTGVTNETATSSSTAISSTGATAGATATTDQHDPSSNATEATTATEAPEGEQKLDEIAADGTTAMEFGSTNDPTDPMLDASNATDATSLNTTSSNATMAATGATVETTTMGTTGTTATEATTPTIPKADYWWPVEPADGTQDTLCVFGSDYLDASVRPYVLFDTEEECCTFYHNCPAPLAVVYWYPSLVENVPTCKNDADYPAEYTANPEFAKSFLFDTQLDCCDAFPSACVGLFWYPSSPGDVAGECVYGGGYPDDMKGHDEYLFFTEGECCAMWCVGEEKAGDTATDATTALPTTAAAAASSSTAATTTTTSTAADRDPCADCTWHESITQFQTCTNSPSYPPAWDHPYARSYFFFRSAEECCASRSPDACTIDSIHAAGGAGSGGDYWGQGGDDGEYTPLGPRTIDDFEGDVRGLPFDFGTPPQWAFNDTMSHSGTRSVTNVKSEELGATADLTLKISVSQPSTLSCWAKINVSMPFEMFYLMVNGVKRNTYHMPDTTGVWTKFLTGLFAGDNEVVFRVENAESLWISRENRTEHFGEGSVWLDACEVNPS